MTYSIDTTDLVLDFVDGCEFPRADSVAGIAPGTGAMTLEQVKKKLEKDSKSYKEFALENGLNYRTVLCVLNGVNKGKRGEAHRAAVALGLK